MSSGVYSWRFTNGTLGQEVETKGRARGEEEGGPPSRSSSAPPALSPFSFLSTIDGGQLLCWIMGSKQGSKAVSGRLQREAEAAECREREEMKAIALLASSVGLSLSSIIRNG